MFVGCLIVTLSWYYWSIRRRTCDCERMTCACEYLQESKAAAEVKLQLLCRARTSVGWGSQQVTILAARSHTVRCLWRDSHLVLNIYTTRLRETLGRSPGLSRRNTDLAIQLTRGIADTCSDLNFLSETPWNVQTRCCQQLRWVIYHSLSFIFFQGITAINI